MSSPGPSNAVSSAIGSACSVVVCCYTMNRWESLSKAITAAADQLSAGDDSSAGDELIIVVDNNDDLLGRVTNEFSDVATVVANRYEAGLSGARNTGVAVASRPLVMFLDDDAAPAPGWIDDLRAPFADPDVVGVGGRARPDWAGGQAPWWMPVEFLWVVGCSYRGLPEHRAAIRNPIGCNMAFRTQAIRDVDGFSAELGRVNDKPVGDEETELAIRITEAFGGTILYEPAALVHHAVDRPRMTLKYFSNRCYSEGRSKAILARRVGAANATKAERAYLATLLTGVTGGLARSVRKRSIRPLGQVAAIGLGLALTTLGFAVGTVVSAIGDRR